MWGMNPYKVHYWEYYKHPKGRTKLQTTILSCNFLTFYTESNSYFFTWTLCVFPVGIHSKFRTFIGIPQLSTEKISHQKNLITGKESFLTLQTHYLPSTWRINVNGHMSSWTDNLLNCTITCQGDNSLHDSNYSRMKAAWASGLLSGDIHEPFCSM